MKRCPNCHDDVIGNTCRSCGMVVYDWVCSDCGVGYFTAGNGDMRFCPACRAKKAKLEQDYWDRKRDGMRSITDDIVAKALAQIGQKGAE